MQVVQLRHRVADGTLNYVNINVFFHYVEGVYVG